MNKINWNIFHILFRFLIIIGIKIKLIYVCTKIISFPFLFNYNDAFIKQLYMTDYDIYV